MAEQGTIRADQIEGLSDLIREQVRIAIQENTRPDLQDVEEVRRSPAGTLIRLEEQVKGVDSKVDQLRSEMDRRFTLLQWAIGLIYPFLLAIVGKLFLMK